MTKSPIKLPPPVFDDPRHHIRLYQGDCLELLALIPESSVDLTLDDALQQFRSHGHSDSDALLIIKTETQIFLA